MKTKLILLAVISALLIQNYVFGQNQSSSEVVQGVFGDEEISIPEAYVFELSVVMELVSNEGKKPQSTMKYKMRYQMDNAAIEMTPLEVDGAKTAEGLKVVVDFGMQRMINFMDGDRSKMAVIYPMDESKIADRGDMDLSVTSFKKTGKVKQILDFECEEYKIQSPDLSGSLWIAPELEINLKKTFEAMGLQIQMGDLGNESQPKGFIMEFETISAKDKARSKMRVLDVNLDDYYELTTDGYVLTMMPLVEREEPASEK